MQTSVGNDTFLHSTQPLKLAKSSKKSGKNPEFMKVVLNGLIHREIQQQKKNIMKL